MPGVPRCLSQADRLPLVGQLELSLALTHDDHAQPNLIHLATINNKQLNSLIEASTLN
jgi:hypothetical protein